MQIIYLLNWINQDKYIVRVQFSYWKTPLELEEDLLVLKICVYDM